MSSIRAFLRPSCHAYDLFLGQPARSRLQPPQDESMPNPDRPSNPFAPFTTPEWALSLRPQPVSRIPYDDPARPAPHTSAELDNVRGSSPATIMQKAPNIHRKQAPPTIPAKPPLLSSPAGQSSPFSEPANTRQVLPPRSQPRGTVRGPSDREMPPPRPARPHVLVSTSRSPIRSPGRALMDDNDDEPEMSGWTPLKPS